MLTEYVTRGMKAGVIGGIAFGVFVATVGNSLIAYAETFEHSHGVPAVSGTVTTVVSVVGGVLLGILLGAVVFGVGYYFLEPLLPGTPETSSYVLAGAGFITVSGAPWVVFPPQPPGVEQSLPADVRIAWYALMMAIGAVACGLAGVAYRRLRPRSTVLAGSGALGSVCLIGLVATAAPANTVTGPIPAEMAAVFRAVTAMGQLGLWLVMGSVHAWLVRTKTVDGKINHTDASSVGSD